MILFLSFSRRVSTEMGERKARELEVMFIETSAKSGHNVKQVCKMLELVFFCVPDAPVLLLGVSAKCIHCLKNPTTKNFKIS